MTRPATLWRGIALALGGAALIMLGAKVQIPFWSVPMTLHTLAVFFLSAAPWAAAGAGGHGHLSDDGGAGDAGLLGRAGTRHRAGLYGGTNGRLPCWLSAGRRSDRLAGRRVAG